MSNWHVLDAEGSFAACTRTGTRRSAADRSHATDRFDFASLLVRHRRVFGPDEVRDPVWRT